MVQINIPMIMNFIRNQFSDPSINMENIEIKTSSFDLIYIKVNGRNECLLILDIEEKTFLFGHNVDSLAEVLNTQDKPLPDDIFAYVY